MEEEIVRLERLVTWKLREINTCVHQKRQHIRGQYRDKLMENMVEGEKEIREIEIICL